MLRARNQLPSARIVMLRGQKGINSEGQVNSVAVDNAGHIGKVLVHGI